MLSQGDPAPPFALPDQDGATVTLASFAGRRVLVYFYPKADTPGCTKQACALDEVLEQVGDTAVVGISPDPPARLRRFADKYSLRFPLLSDADHAVAEAYGVWVEKVLYGKRSFGIQRSAFLVGPDGRLERVWYKVKPEATATNLLAALQAGAS